MRRSLLLGILLLIVPCAMAVPRNVPVVMHPGQELTYSAAAPLLTVTFGAGNARPVSMTFDRYATRIQLTAKTVGTATLLCEHADNRVGEIITVTVVPQRLYQLHQRVLNALGGVEGLTATDITVTDRIIITGNVYAQSDLERCIDLERGEKSLVCGARLSSAAAFVTPGMGYNARANVEMEWLATDMAAADAATWRVTVRLGDVPVFAAVSRDRARVLTTAGALARKLNEMVVAWRAETDRKGMAYPVVFRSRKSAGGVDIVSTWSTGQGSAGQTLVTLPLEHLADIAGEARLDPERLVQWWLAILQDAFRMYFMAERPIRATASPLVELYQTALRLRRAALDERSAQTALARAYFGTQLAHGRDPFAKLLITPSADFMTSSAP